MFIKKMLVLVSAAALGLFTAQPSFAQSAGAVTASAASAASSAAVQTRSSRRGQRATPSAEEVRTSVETLVAQAGLNCRVGETFLLGVNGEQQSAYETTCASGPGYVIVGSTPPLVFDCLELQAQAEQAHARDPNADVGLQCKIPQNLDTVAIVKGYATQAAVTCTVDQAAVVGKSLAGNVVYEVGCAGAGGYWLEKQNGSWVATECLEVASSGASCRFTTAAEDATTLQALLMGTEAAGCQVEQVRLMGSNNNGRFYEAKCAAGDGYIARVNTAGQTQQVYACAIAQHIGDGCKLTPPPAAAAPASTEQH